MCYLCYSKIFLQITLPYECSIMTALIPYNKKVCLRGNGTVVIYNNIPKI